MSRWLAAVVLLTGCSSGLATLPSDPALVARIGAPEVREAWIDPDHGYVVVKASVAEERASELCGRITAALDGPSDGVLVIYREFPWGSVLCMA
jgi:hypothetical protein